MTEGGKGGDGSHGPEKGVGGGITVTQVPMGVPSWHRFIAIAETAEFEPKLKKEIID